jgi:hypothetical protein
MTEEEHMGQETLRATRTLGELTVRELLKTALSEVMDLGEVLDERGSTLGERARIGSAAARISVALDKLGR